MALPAGCNETNATTITTFVCEEIAQTVMNEAIYAVANAIGQPLGITVSPESRSFQYGSAQEGSLAVETLQKVITKQRAMVPFMAIHRVRSW